MRAAKAPWGTPPDLLATLRGYDPDVGKNRAEARSIMERLGYGPDRPLAVTVSTRNIPAYRNPAVILIDQLKEVYIDGQLVPIENGQLVSQGHAHGLIFCPTDCAEPDSREHKAGHDEAMVVG